MVERDPDKTEPSAVQTFFDRGDRRMHLEQLRHLSQWSRRVLLVTGPRGVGKSALYRQLSASLEPRAKAARINGTLVSGTREVLNAMVQGFGLAAPADADTQVLRQLIGDHAREQERAERFCVALIDDAELLEFRALEQLIGLAHGSPLRLVMFGEVRLVPAVERAAESVHVGWHEIRLSGFGVDDARAYLQWRFRQQGYGEALPFTDAQVKEITRLSEGLPGRMDQMANVLLARIQSAGSGPPVRRRFPAVHRALLAVLVVALAFAYLLWRPTERGIEPPGVTMAASGEPTDEPAAAAARAVESEPDAGDEQAVIAADAGNEPLPAQDGETVEEPPTAVSAGAAAAPAEDDLTDVAAAADPAASAGAREAQAAPNHDDQAQPTESPAPVVPAAAQTADSGGVHGPEWIMRQPGQRYTLQLVSFSTAERANTYLAEQDDPGAFSRYQLERDGRTLFVVTYGSYESRASAQQAAGDLPGAIGNVQPWIRTFAQVQEAIGARPR